MEKLTSGIKTTTAADLLNLKRAGREQTQQQRDTMVPGVAMINNFDPDQRTFLTDVMKGFSLVQRNSDMGVVNTLTVQADYNAKVPDDSDYKSSPVPGQSVLIYPVAGQSGSMNTSFIRAGDAESKRFYPIVYLQRNAPVFVVLE